MDMRIRFAAARHMPHTSPATTTQHITHISRANNKDFMERTAINLFMSATNNFIFFMYLSLSLSDSESPPTIIKIVKQHGLNGENLCGGVIK